MRTVSGSDSGRSSSSRSCATPLMRARYWARSLIGWRSFGRAEPERRAPRAGRGSSAAARSGCSSRRTSTACTRPPAPAGSSTCTAVSTGWSAWPAGRRPARAGWQQHLSTLNRDWVGLDAPVAPDGDADLDGLDFSTFVVPACPRCGGVVKPDVVFFGENVPPWRHAQATAALSHVRRHARRRLVADGALRLPLRAGRGPARACRSPPSTSAARGPTTCSRSSSPRPPARH